MVLMGYFNYLLKNSLQKDKEDISIAFFLKLFCWIRDISCVNYLKDLRHDLCERSMESLKQMTLPYAWSFPAWNFNYKGGFLRTRNLASAVRTTLFQILQKCAALSIVFFISKVAIYFAWKIFIHSLKHLSNAKKSYWSWWPTNVQLWNSYYSKTKSKAVYNVWWPMKTPFDLVQGADNDKVELLERLISLKNGTSAWGNFFVTPPPMCHFMSVPYSSHMCLSIRKHVHFFQKHK